MSKKSKFTDDRIASARRQADTMLPV